MSDTTSFRRTLRQMAEAEDLHDRRRLFDMLASQIEVALDNHANQTQVVVWDVQEAAYRKIDDLHAHQSDTNMLLSGVAESLALIQGSVQQVLAANKETALGLKKVQREIALLKMGQVTQAEQFKESVADRAGLHREIAGVKTDVAALQSRVDEYMAGSRRGEVDALRAELREMRGDIPPEQRQRYVSILLQMIAEWEAAHEVPGDGDG